MINRLFTAAVFLILQMIISFASGVNGKTLLFKEGLFVIPYPQSVVLQGNDYTFGKLVDIHIEKGLSDANLFAANELSLLLRSEFGLDCRIISGGGKHGVFFSHTDSASVRGEQGYRIESSGGRIIISASGPAGFYYGVQT
jgi:hexosaminidase